MATLAAKVGYIPMDRHLSLTPAVFHLKTWVTLTARNVISLPVKDLGVRKAKPIRKQRRVRIVSRPFLKEVENEDFPLELDLTRPIQAGVVTKCRASMRSRSTKLALRKTKLPNSGSLDPLVSPLSLHHLQPWKKNAIALK